MPLCICKREGIDDLDGLPDIAGAFFGIKGTVRGKQNVVHAEELQAALGSRGCTEQGGVCIEAFEVLQVWFLETFEDAGIILIRGTSSQLSPACAYPTLEVGNHAAHVVGNDLEVGKLIEVASEYQPGHDNTGLIGPAEYKPDLVFGFLFGEVVREVGPSCRVDPDGQVIAGHLFKQGLQFREV